MNFKLVARITGMTLLLEAVTMLLPMFVGMLYGETPVPFLLSIAITAAVGFALMMGFRKADHSFYAREGFFTVGLIWVLFGAFGALPFQFCGYFNHYIDCFFETISGFTTTGATILTEIESLPKGILFWRSFTHWLGGMGVLVLTTALLPFLGLSSNFLIRAESPGPVKSKLVPRAAQSSLILYSIYLGLTLLEVLFLKIAGMNWFDAFNHSMATAGTGGFSTRSASVAAYGSPVIEVIITVFMLLFSVNFSIYFLIITGRVKQALKSDELRFFLCVVAFAILVITWNIRDMYETVSVSLRLAAFQVASVISTTGFVTADFDKWPVLSKMLLVVLMFVGACAGSTGGGMKCSRILVLYRTCKREVRSIVHPRAVTVVRLDGAPLPERTIQTTGCFFVIYIFLTFCMSLVVGLDNFSFTTTLTSVITCISNVGPGLDVVGPTGNFQSLSMLSKLVLSFAMVLGRLEMYPILVLFSRSAWSRF